jgi:hypothetical protein
MNFFKFASSGWVYGNGIRPYRTFKQFYWNALLQYKYVILEPKKEQKKPLSSDNSPWQ